MPKRPGVSVVIPTYNGLSLLKKNLPLVVKMLRPGDELIIVDDASTDESVRWLQKTFRVPAQVNLQIIVNSQNQRFAATSNRGVQSAQNSLVFLLNNDAQPEADVLDQLAAFFADRTVFAVGCLEIEPPLDATGQPIKGGKNRLWFERGIFFHARAYDFKSGDTAWASGGSAMFDRQKWLELGGFDLSFYPAYWEDIDLSFRARKKGWQVLFSGQAIVRHQHETTHEGVFGQKEIERISWRNSLYFTWKNANFYQKILFLLWRPYWWYKSKI